ncbi:FAD-dependent oxidoreductase, partial [Methylobacterium sp. WL116]|uniref:flavin monoamine oxidase family protein n=1 Tax=Methylobacterium sp. WL116 TaxID=2603889 RepID=UPI0011C7496D
LPIALDCPVAGIDWTGAGVRVATADERTLKARVKPVRPEVDRMAAQHRRDRVALVHGLVSGRPLEEVSLQDFPSMEYGDNYFVAGGYGGYLARLAQGLPIALDCPVAGIDWTGAGVRVATADERTLKARAVIVTVPMMVLRDSVAFSPALPAPIRAAIDGFRVGIYEHAVLHWPSSPFRGRDRLASLVGGRFSPPGLLTRIDGTPFHYFELDSVGAAEIDAAGTGEDGLRRRVRATLADHFGARRLHDLSIPAVSEWRHDPWSRGSWASVPRLVPKPDATLQLRCG